MSAIDMAIKKVIAYKWICIQHASAANKDVDGLMCFDNMVIACQNLSCLSKGAAAEYLKLHAQMQQNSWLYIKHAYGISEGYNFHLDKHPWHGAGQGTGDAALHWTVQSNSLFHAYKSLTRPWEICNPAQTIQVHQDLDGCVDDVNLITGSTDHNHTLLQLNAQTNLQLWQDILAVSRVGHWIHQNADGHTSNGCLTNMVMHHWWPHCTHLAYW